MIINISRAKVAYTCWRKAFNQFHRRLEGPRSMNLVDGGAFHDGVAAGMATQDWAAAHTAAAERFARDAENATIPPEQAYLLQQHSDLVHKMIDVYRENWGEEKYTVIQPECEFDVQLPGKHNCIFLHWYDFEEQQEKWGEPLAEKILRGAVAPAHPRGMDERCKCYTHHRFVGKTDNIVAYNHNLWLQEHKTTAISGQQFWNQWLLDIQPTGYLYGIWKTLHVRPSGFILNAIMKPSEAQVASYNKRRKYGAPTTQEDYISFERQAFLRTEEDLWRFERQITNLCDEWEWRVTRGYFDMAPIPGACISYNRLCDFHMACTSHDDPTTLETMTARAKDYVDVKLEDILTRSGQVAGSSPVASKEA